LAPISTAEQVSPARAHVLDRDHATGCHDLQARFQQQLFGKGIADLHGGALLSRIVVEFG